jgi:hypothetical protein
MTTIRFWMTAAAVSLSVAMVQPAVGAPTVKGDTAAWAEVVAALTRQHATTFRGKSTETGKTTIIEFAPPDSQHRILQGYSDMIAPEGITVGNSAWKRDHNGKWDCAHPVRLTPADAVPLWDRKGEVTATRVPDLVIGGMQTHGYAYTQTFEISGISLTMKVRLYVAAQTGLPLRQITDTGKTASTFDYYDYGTKITITPPCS